MATSSNSTLYPKITTHIPEIVKTLKEINCNSATSKQEAVLGPIPIVGTVKLHGTHADILIHNDNRIVFQSRNVVGLNTTKDNAGFATCMSSKTKALLRLRDLYLARWQQLNALIPIDPTLPVLMAGEWIGKGVESGVAICELSKRFVIVSVNINGLWQKDIDYGGIALPNHGIYNVSRAGYFNAALYPEEPQRTIDELQALAEQIAKQCPFAETFGLQGEGEGLVWKPALPPYNSNPDLWFKTKGGRFKPTFARPPRQSPENVEQSREAAAAVAKMWCSDQRMGQGLDYMEEKGIKRNMKGLTQYLSWVQNDILIEEKGYIAEHKIDVPSLKIEIAKIAKPWYTDRLECK
jgi:hypothetical protein